MTVNTEQISDNPSSLIEPNQTQPQTTSDATISPKSNNKNKLLIFIGVFVLIAVSSVSAYYLGVKRTNTVKTSTTNEGNINPQLSGEPISSTPVLSGQLKRLTQNLQIFKATEDDKLNGIENDFVYYEAGKFNQGELKDYSRVIAIRPSGGPGQPLVFVLATNDYQKYVLDDPDNKTTKYPENDWQNPYNYLDKSKILSTSILPTEQSRVIKLDQNFSLYFENFPTNSVQTNKIDKNGNKVYEALLPGNFSTYQKLTSIYKNLTFYFQPYQRNAAYLNQLNPTEKEKEQTRQQYLLGDTEVFVVDSTGLPAAYSLTTPENIKSYSNKLSQYEIALRDYEVQLKKYQEKQITEYPKYPDYVYLPNLGFNSLLVENKNNLKLFSNYETAIPAACSSTMNSQVVNVKDGELEQIGSVFNMPLYRLKDINHKLNVLSYKNKTDYYEQDSASWDQVNTGIKKPTFQEYASSNPLLFIKDYWQRWVALGEFDIKLLGGCGKPVIYLYPTQPTQISVKFQAPVQLTTDIPKYADFWQVLAYSNGSLVNLKPELTDCGHIDYREKGSEYAELACRNNTYPYLYWAGNVNSKNYPSVNRGWIVEKGNLGEFFNKKLTEVGFNNKEKTDFISYWLFDMLEKDAPYYRVSFLQTNDLNLLFPMTVDPKPDTTFRLFLDYLPLTEKPKELLQPQELNKLVRSGFTLVEWGGLKQP